MMTGRTDIALSDDTDPAPLPYSYQGLIDTLSKNPKHFFYGSVAVEGQGIEGAVPAWYSWVERWLVIALNSFLPLEQLNAGVVFCVMFLTAMLMYLMARYLGWSQTLAMAAAIAFAFTPFTRARAKVHGMLAGTFHIPAIFLGLYLIARGKSWRSIALGGGLFLLTAMTAHYYVVTSAFLSPLFVLFYFLQPEVKTNYKKASIRLVSAMLPAVLFLVFNLTMPVPDDVQLASSAIPKSGETRTGEIHPFLTYFSAHPIDYISGDIAAGPKDLNPIRSAISSYVLSHLEKSNSHERSNGIRWIMIFLAASAIYYLFFKPDIFTPMQKSSLWIFLGFSAVAFWLSLSPDFPFQGMGLSGLQYKLISQIRVPSRAGIWVNFSVIMMAGIFIHSLCQKQNSTSKKKKIRKQKKQEEKKSLQAQADLPRFFKWMCIPSILPLIVFIELPPFLQNPTTSQVRPIYPLISNIDNCGAGMHFPFTSPTFALRPHYHFLQRMRKSRCLILNQVFDPATAQHILQRFAYHPNLFKALKERPDAVATSLVNFARCLPMTWIVFDTQIPDNFSQKVCHTLGWQWNPDKSCVSEKLTQPMQRKPKEC